MSRSQHSQPFSGAQRGSPRACAWRSSLGAWRQGWLWLSALASLGLPDSASAESRDLWRPNPSVGLLEGVALRIHWFASTTELRKAAKNNGQAIRQAGLRGFSVLKRDTQTGEYVCDLYVVKMTGAHVDGEFTTTFGHEVLHCFGLEHE